LRLKIDLTNRPMTTSKNCKTDPNYDVIDQNLKSKTYKIFFYS